MPEPSRLITRGRVVAGLVVLVVVAAAVWFLAVPHFTVKHEGRPPGDGDLSAACGDPGVAYTSVHAYSGPGPHLTTVYAKVGKEYTSGAVPAGLPASWQPPAGSDVQLIVCIEKRGSNGYLDTVNCSYGPRGLQQPTTTPMNVSMNDTVYRATLREVRTHKKIAQVDMNGQDTKCPGTFTPGDVAVDSHLTAKQLTRAFGRYTG